MKKWVRCLRLLDFLEKVLRLVRAGVGIGLVLTICGAFRSRRFG